MGLAVVWPVAAEPLAVAVGAVGFPTQSTSVAVTVWLGGYSGQPPPY